MRPKKCQLKGCKDRGVFGISNKRAQFCEAHAHEGMVNVILENKCSDSGCEKEYDHIVEGIRYCSKHIPDGDYASFLKRKCKYCDLFESTAYVCKDCRNSSSKKEWAIVRHLKKSFDRMRLEYNTSSMLQGLSKKRPDIFINMEERRHCVIVEVDEHQHNTYEDTCECSRLCEIVGSLCYNKPHMRSVTVIRYNPDTVRSKGKPLSVPPTERIPLLEETIRSELDKEYPLDAEFTVKIVQLYYDDAYDVYAPSKEEDVTNLITV